MDNLKLLLNKSKSKQSINHNNSLTINFVGSEKLLPCDEFTTAVNEMDVYNKERQECNTIRLTVCVNPICSNVLFNNVTEIVRNEGTDFTQCLNFTNLSNINDGINDEKGEEFKWDDKNLKFKTKQMFDDDYNGDIGTFKTTKRINNLIRDTQLNNNSNNFVYHCGIDIFNNHYLRSNTFKTICPFESTNNKEYYFNTIHDYMRSYNGKVISGFTDDGVAVNEANLPLHLYLADEISSYKDTINEKLIEENGWFGFTNVGKMKIYNDESEDQRNMDYDWFKVINNRKPCDFIDMYPTRDLFYFDPKYNHYRQRLEKNWHYFLTYPSSSTTEGISFIKTHKNGSTSLKIMLFDDTIKAKNGTNAIKIWSVSKHGLNKDNIINIYKGDNIEIKNAKVIDVVNEYVFYVYSNGIKLSKKWLSVNDMVEDDISNDRKMYKGTYYIINNEKCNIDDDAQDISFTRIVDYNEVEYYVRIFSKLPNWKFADKRINEKLLYKDDVTYIEEYQKIKNEFDNTIGKIAFSKNIYNDNITEIVFTDDINIGSLKDNLGRPLTDIYFTIIKNNQGYKEWYGKNDECNINSDLVEYSHCFGKLSCAFKLSDESIPNLNYNNLSLINNIDNTFSRNGLDVSSLNNRNDNNDYDEILVGSYNVADIDNDIHYYGDLCCYSRAACDEQIIQDIGFRFNTAQRELTKDFSNSEYITNIMYDEIQSDDYDDVGFKIKEYILNDSVQRKEGYYYNPHYRIRIKSLSKEITEVYPKFLTAKSIELYNGNKTKLYTMENHDLGNGDRMFIYDLSSSTKYECIVETVSNRRNIILDVELPDYSDKRRYKYFKVIDDLPSYAYFMHDGSCRYVYREIIQNGYDNYSDIEEYPFTNGALYVNKNINLFLRRQNPEGIYDIRSKTYPYDITTNNISFKKENKYYEEDNIEC